LNFAKLFKGLFARKLAPKPLPAADPRLAADPWLGELFARLGDRYQLGEDGARILRRTGRARFNPMPVWIRGRAVSCDYEVRAAGAPETAAAEAGKLLDLRVGPRLAQLGLAKTGDKLEEWAGTVLVRGFEGRYDRAESAAAAIRFICEDTETQLNTAAE
jgi:hypothetical protein